MNTRKAFVGFTVMLFVSCNSNNGAKGPCESDNPPAACTQECAEGGIECPTGFHCGETTCTAECTLGGGECGTNAYCDLEGNCIEQDCPSVQVNAEPQTPMVQLLIDRSGSMDQNFPGANDRWDAVDQALFQGNDAVVGQLQEAVLFGATLYNSVGGGSVPNECPILITQQPAFNSLDSLADLFAPNQDPTHNGPQSDTPTAESVTAVANAFPTHDGPRVIVLATDGDPDSCADPDSNGEDPPRDATEAAVQAAHGMGIQTYVLWVGDLGDGDTRSHLQRVANLGVGRAADDANPAPYYVGDNQQALTDAFNAIVGNVRGCTFILDGTVDPDRACEGTVTLNGDTLTCGEDWSLVNPTTVQLLGDTCQQFINDENVDLTAEFPCGAAIVDG